MNEFEKTLYEVLSYLGVNFKKFLKDKNERIKAHKYCYLLSKFYRLPVDGAFSLYVNGPYNHYLTDVLYEIARTPNKRVRRIKNGELLAILDTFSSLFPANGANVVNNLEIFTTFDFLNTNYPSMSKEERFEMLRRIKGHLFNSETNLDNLNNWGHRLGLIKV